MYANQLINEAEVQATWGPVIESSTGITDKSKLTWMSKYCHYHSLNENVNNYVHLNPNMNVQSMGAVVAPGNPGGLDAFKSQAVGSGDKATSLLPLAIQVAAQTYALDLVPVIPMQGPYGILTYLDVVYGGGRVATAGGINGNAAPLTIKVKTEAIGTPLAVDDVIYVGTGTTAGSYELTYVAKSRIDGYSIFRVRGKSSDVLEATEPYAQGKEGYEPIYVAITASTQGYDKDDVATRAAVVNFDSGAELVKALEDHITGFTGNAFSKNNPSGVLTSSGIDEDDPYERGEGESTTDNIMGLTLFNKSIAAKTYQVAAAVTREQVQDLKQFGIDAVSQVESVLLNELTQSINKLIVGRIFKLGVSNAYQTSQVDGTVLSAAFTTGSSTSVSIALGKDTEGNSRSVTVNSVVVNGGAETQGTIQRRILTKVLAASNLIATRGRRGPASFAVTSGKMATAMQDIAGFVAYPMANTVNQQSGALYPIGSIAGIMVYVDPNRSFDDTKIVVGRKGDGNSPGLVFMPYLMAESVETIAEGTMAPKIAVKSRFALVEAGHHPQTMYYTLNFSLNGIDLI